MAMTEQQIQLVIAAQGGDVKSFEQLYAIYYDKVYGFARMILKNERDAEDVLQEAFITAWRKLNTLQTPATFSVWIQIIAKNLCNMQLRRKNMAILLDAEQDIENIDIEDGDDLLPAVYAEKEDLRERLGKIIDSLSDVQRQTVVLYYFNELSVDEISDIMECSPGTVKSRLFLARNAIKAEVEEQERKSGQKFYGVAGLPMLPLGKLIQAHMERLSIGQGAANASLNAITNSISNTTAGANAAATTSMEGIKMAKLSLGAKIALAVTAVAVVGAAAVLAAILITGNPANSPPNSEAPPGTSSTAPGETSEPTDSDPTASPGNTSDPANSTTSPGGTASPGIGDPGMDGVDLKAAIAKLPNKDGLDDIFAVFSGYWRLTTGGDQFVGFTYDENDSSPVIYYGLYGTSSGGRGKVTTSAATGQYTATLTIKIPAIPADHMEGPQPEKTVNVYIDISEQYQGKNTLKIKIDGFEGSAWKTYKYGAGLLEDAF